MQQHVYGQTSHGNPHPIQTTLPKRGPQPKSNSENPDMGSLNQNVLEGDKRHGGAQSTYGQPPCVSQNEEWEYAASLQQQGNITFSYGEKNTH